jgi:hypothetical protein
MVLRCSDEHETLFCQGLAAVGDPNAAAEAFPAAGTESMAEASLKPLKAILETIREQADKSVSCPAPGFTS